MPSRPRSQKLWTLALRSAKTSGVPSARESKTLITPRFSATKTRPAGENRRAVGFVKPLNTTDSENPVGVVAPCASDVTERRARPPATKESPDARTSPLRPRLYRRERPSANKRPEPSDTVENQLMTNSPACRLWAGTATDSRSSSREDDRDARGRHPSGW